ncbi:MAG: haloacid dehalogenase [Oscillospiraceae bacterium]
MVHIFGGQVNIRGGNDSGIDTCWFNPGGKQADGMIQPTYEISALAGLKEIL